MGVKCVVEGHGCSKIVASLHETVTLEVCNGDTLVLESSSSVSMGITFIISLALLLALFVRFSVQYSSTVNLLDSNLLSCQDESEGKFANQGVGKAVLVGSISGYVQRLGFEGESPRKRVEICYKQVTLGGFDLPSVRGLLLLWVTINQELKSNGLHTFGLGFKTQ